MSVAGLRLACMAAALTAAIAPAGAASVPVKTSRGEFRLLLFEPERPDPAKPLVLLISGEGGWRRFDDLLTGMLRGAGCWVGGIDITKYFWEAQDDRQALAADVRAHADALAAAASRGKEAPLVIAGFSFGADLAPWVAGAGGWENRLRGLIMVGPDETGSLQFRIVEILGFEAKDHVFSVAEALESSKGIPVALIHGEKDDKSAALQLAGRAAEPKRLLVVAGADHHFSGAEEKLKAVLLEALQWIAPPEKHE